MDPHHGLVHLGKDVLEPVQVPDFLFGAVFVEGDFDGGFQFPVVKGFEDIAV